MTRKLVAGIQTTRELALHRCKVVQVDVVIEVIIKTGEIAYVWLQFWSKKVIELNSGI